ncbi:MAG: GldG family protein [Chloroflexota bacterium]|nr:GldG family protein [Chloroflexota bacterium]|tara:strand:+ start:56 stop:1912 length:1857 start_codon:yes stop_codon:yes gene_type:complete
MTTPSNPDSDGLEQENQRPRDWRRRSRSERTAPQADVGQQAQPRVAETDEELSQPLITFFEPALDLIALYSGPLILAGVIALVTGIAVVAFISSMRLYGYIDIVIGGVLLGGVGSVLFSNVLTAFLSRTGRYGANTLILVGAFTGIIIVTNVISFENNSRMDVTATNQFSLGTRTKDVLSNLSEDVRATAFYKDEKDTDTPDLAVRRNKVLNTLEEFDSRSSKFTYRVVDPDLKPEIVGKFFGARPAGFVTEIVVVEGMDSGQFDVLQPTDASYTELEQDLVTSTLVATGSEKKVIYFLSGHGERDINGPLSDGYAAVRSGLEGDNYRVEELFWEPADLEVEVPLDAALLVIAGPTSSLPEPHETALDQFLEGLQQDGTPRREHGRMIFMAEPDTPISFRNFFADWGLLISSGYIRDIDSSVPGLPQTISLRSFNPEAPLEITLPKGERLQNVFMPGATAIGLLQDDLRSGLPIAATSSNSYLIDEPDRVEPITDGSSESDQVGPFVPAVRLQSIGQVGAPVPTSQPDPSEISDLIMFGDSDFLSNSSYNQGGGSDLFLNSANFLVGDYSLVSIRPKQFSFREFNLDANEYDFVRFSSWLFLPGIMAMMASLVWWIRR